VALINNKIFSHAPDLGAFEGTIACEGTVYIRLQDGQILSIAPEAVTLAE
jgi:hypothetical protein